MHRKKHYSLIRRITIIFTSIYCILLLLMTANNFYALHTIKHNLYTHLHDTIVQENKLIATDLYDVSSYLSSFNLTTPNLSTIELNRKDSNYYSALYKLKMELTSALTSMSLMQGLFAFPTESQMFIYANTGSYSAEASIHIRNWLRTSLQSGTLNDYVSKYWFPMEFDGRYYLIRLLKTGGSYVGAWTDFTSMLDGVNSFESLAPVILYAFSDNEMIGMDSIKADYHFPLDKAIRDVLHIRLDRSYLAVGVPSSYTETGGIYVLVPYSKITNQLQKNYLFVFISSTLCLFIALAAIQIVRKFLGKPLEELQTSLIALKNGDFSTRLREDEVCSEFSDVSVAFNQMVHQIEDLKINIYEEKLRKQKTEMQSLKNQIAPHFLINCLNAIYHMAAVQKTDEIQNMTVFLGEHLRYALADVTLVPLQEELNKVLNYIELSKIRFPGCIETYLDIDEALLDAMVPPMVLLFQIENIIKYEVINGEVTEIHIEVHKTASKTISLCTWDSGTGYATDVLRQLQSEKMLSQSTGHNIGTRNTIQRLHLMFGNQFSICFSNRKDAGAQVHIIIPYQTTQNIE